jgi:hypothetical protein
MRTRTKILAGIAVILFLLVYPFNVTVAPEWNVKVVDENGKALAGAYVLEFATQWTLDYHFEEAVCSNANGEAHFPRRTLPASALTRVSKWVSGLGPHSSLGPDVKIGAERLGSADMRDESSTAAWNGWANRVNSQFVLRTCPSGFTGYKCKFNYDTFFAGYGSSGRKIAACLSRPR